MPSIADEHLRSLLTHVRLRTRVKNQLDGMAMNEGLVGQRVWLDFHGVQANRKRLLFAVNAGPVEPNTFRISVT
jgi:hypothetical protein